jgi:hypothetical protein
MNLIMEKKILIPTKPNQSVVVSPTSSASKRSTHRVNLKLLEKQQSLDSTIKEVENIAEED